VVHLVGCHSLSESPVRCSARNILDIVVVDVVVGALDDIRGWM
jgi:hypothetical protein